MESIVMGSMSERSSAGLVLPELRIPQGQAKQISHTLFYLHVYTQPESPTIHLHRARSHYSIKTGFCVHPLLFLLNPFFKFQKGKKGVTRAHEENRAILSDCGISGHFTVIETVQKVAASRSSRHVKLLIPDYGSELKKYLNERVGLGC